MAELRQAHLKHYEAESRSTVRERLATLLDLTLQCLSCGRADPMIDYTTRVARERFAGGYDLLEVQTSMNVMEESLWKRILCSMEPVEVAHALGLVSTILGMGKDALARAYVSLAARSGAPRVGGIDRAGESPAAQSAAQGEAICGSVFPERLSETSTESD
jgi:hypothetical protein